MADSNPRTMLDRLGRVSEEERAKLARIGVGGTSPARDTRLRFQAGDKVIDLATGRSGVVQTGAIGEHVEIQLFRVELSTGQIVYRDANELAPYAPAAVVRG